MTTIERNISGRGTAPVIDLSGAEGKLCLVTALGLFYTAAWVALDPPEPPEAAGLAEPAAAAATLPASNRADRGATARPVRATKPIRIRTRSS